MSGLTMNVQNCLVARGTDELRRNEERSWMMVRNWGCRRVAAGAKYTAQDQGGARASEQAGAGQVLGSCCTGKPKPRIWGNSTQNPRVNQIFLEVILTPIPK